MGKISKLPDNERYEIIGYLAQPGVVATITAEVPEKKRAEFEAKYGVRPYPITSNKKYGAQYRLYLENPDDCPDDLKKALDKRMPRLNDNEFIKELVEIYGFSFFRSTQNSHEIQKKAEGLGETEYQSFMRGFDSSKNFIATLQAAVKSTKLSNPTVQMITPSKTSTPPKKRKKTKDSLLKQLNGCLTNDQMLQLGWIGEQYFYNIIKNKSNNILSSFGISPGASSTITWFNEGFDTNPEWADKSIGMGCDILIESAGKKIYIEVKSSKKKSPIFTMTKYEMQTMKSKKKKYFLVKIDNIEHLITGGIPDVKIFSSPFEYFFVPDRMYSAIFYCN